MPTLRTDDGVSLNYHEAGSGTPVVFVHEFAGDARSFEPQLRQFARTHRCIAYNARGYPPSDVPGEPQRYSQDRARDDIRAVLDALGISRAHVCGISMGAFATLHFGLRYPERALSLVVGGCGYGAEPKRQAQFRAEAEQTAAAIRAEGMEAFAARYSMGPTRVQFLNKDPRGFAEFQSQLAQHSAEGSALTMLGVQRLRPSLYDLREQLGAMAVPTLVVTGDEDEPCLDPGLMLKRTIPTARLAVLPGTGHALNLEEPALFNRLIGDFWHLVESGRYAARDPRSVSAGILGGKP
jgi:pimeloyl-ACP methyl ester carboxylesterase